MESSESSLNNIVRVKHRSHNFALISVVVILLFSIGLILTGFRLNELNQEKIGRFVQAQQQVDKKVQDSAVLQSKLELKQNEINALRKKLNAATSMNLSLKDKLTNTLKLLATAREASKLEPPAVPQETAVTAEVSPDLTPADPNITEAASGSDLSLTTSTITEEPAMNGSSREIEDRSKSFPASDNEMVSKTRPVEKASEKSAKIPSEQEKINKPSSVENRKSMQSDQKIDATLMSNDSNVDAATVTLVPDDAADSQLDPAIDHPASDQTTTDR